MLNTAKNLYRKLRAKYYETTFTPYVIERNAEGVQFKCYIADRCGQDWYDNGDNHWAEMGFLKDKMISENDTIFEAGAHHGVTTTFLGKLLKRGKIYVFEANPFNASVIHKNLELNKLNNVDVANKAVGAGPGKINISYSSNSIVQKTAAATYEVDLVNLDTYKHLNPTFLKIDVEGFEVEVLKGAQEILKTRPKLEVEIHTLQLPNFNASVSDVFNLLDLTTYDCWIKWPNGIRPYDPNEPINVNVNLLAIPR